MERQCRANNVRVDMRKQMFHVRKGQVRKNLKSERWRKKFSASFSGAVGRVLRMKSQGW